VTFFSTVTPGVILHYKVCWLQDKTRSSTSEPL